MGEPEVLEEGFQVEVTVREACKKFASHTLLHMPRPLYVQKKLTSSALTITVEV